MDKNKIYIVKNRSASMVGYRIPEDNIRREFAPGETKKLTFGELEKLTYQAGGRELMANFLQIIDEKVTEDLNIYTTPEYWMSEQNIMDLIKHGTYDAWLDALDYAPIGALDLIKQYSVSVPLTDTKKIEALLKKTGFDASKAIANKKAEAEKEDDNETAAAQSKVAEAAPTGRRSTVSYKDQYQTEEEAAPAVKTPEYKVVSSSK